METNVNYSIRVKSSREDYKLIKKFFSELYEKRKYFPTVTFNDYHQIIKVDHSCSGGVYNAIEDILLLHEIIKDDKSFFVFDVEGIEDSDYGNFNCFRISYFDKKATIRQFYFDIFEHKEELVNLNIAAAGKLKYFTNHEDLASYIDEWEGMFVENVSSKTNLLITNNPEADSKKINMAKELNIPILSEIEFIDKFVADGEFDINDEDMEKLKTYEFYEKDALENLEYVKAQDLESCYCNWEIRDVDLELVKELKNILYNS